MTTWSDIYSDLQNFWNWISGVVKNPVDDFLHQVGSIGAYIFSGLKWFADQFYKAWQWLADKIHGAISYLGDKFHDAWNILSSWIGSGLSWIGSGIAWVGQQLYNFGMWLYNGLKWVAGIVHNIISKIVHWIYSQLSNIWNAIAGTISSWIQGMNDYVNNWFLSLREKLAHMLAINLSFLGIEKSFNMLEAGDFKKGLLMLFGSPFIGIFASYLVDSIIPRPQSQRVIFFPEIEFPGFTPDELEIPLPSEPTAPPPSPTHYTPYKPITPPYTGRVELYELSLVKVTAYVSYPTVRKVTNEATTSVKTSVVQGVSALVSEKSVTSVKTSVVSPSSIKTSESAKTLVKTSVIAPTAIKVSESSLTKVSTTVIEHVSSTVSNYATTSVKTEVIVHVSTSVTEKSSTSVKTSVIAPTAIKVSESAKTSVTPTVITSNTVNYSSTNVNTASAIITVNGQTSGGTLSSFSVRNTAKTSVKMSVVSPSSIKVSEYSKTSVTTS